jgi:hypothetical protein
MPAQTGACVASVGFPLPAVMGTSPRFGTGHVATLSGPGDSPRLIQVSMPVQPRHFGVSLLDASSHVVGVVIAQLEKIGMLMQEGHLPESVNHPVRGIILAALPNSLPETARLGPARGSTGPLADAEIARLAEPACGLVLLDR